MTLNDKLKKVEELSAASRGNRLFSNPFKYLFAILFRMLIYPLTQKEILLKTKVFFGKKILIALPASTDIYLTRGKSHHSEIRLARFLIKNLKVGSKFMDIGAHYGYFSMLASEIIGKEGKVLSLEPSALTYSILKKNISSISNAEAINMAVSDKEGNLIFYEFPNLYSEYNSMDISQFEGQDWYKKSPPKKVEIPCSTVDVLCKNKNFIPDIIKIDVEGAEKQVISGAATILTNNKTLLVMEYLNPERHNESHLEAKEILNKMGYFSYLINNEGNLIPISDIDSYLKQKQLESDNIVFMPK